MGHGSAADGAAKKIDADQKRGRRTPSPWTTWYLSGNYSAQKTLPPIPVSRAGLL